MLHSNIRINFEDIKELPGKEVFKNRYKSLSKRWEARTRVQGIEAIVNTKNSNIKQNQTELLEIKNIK